MPTANTTKGRPDRRPSINTMTTSLPASVPVSKHDATPTATSRSSEQAKRETARRSDADPSTTKASDGDLGGARRRKPGPPKGCLPLGHLPARAVADRFLAKVDRSGPDGHWVWMDALVRGRGLLKVAGKVENAAHGSVVLFVGPISPDARVTSGCGRRAA